MALEEDLSEPARLLLLVSLLAKDRLISHNGEAWGVQNRHKQKKDGIQNIPSGRLLLLLCTNSYYT